MHTQYFEERYARQLLLPEVGREGQLRLAQKRVVVVGAGGLGCAILPLLAAGGVGQLVICDDDVVSLSNLPRQILYTEAQIGQPKAALAAERLRANNAACEVTVHATRLTADNAPQLLADCDLIVDATDNEATRRLIDAYSVAHAAPWLYVSVEGWCGQIALFDGVHGSFASLFPPAEAANQPSIHEESKAGASDAQLSPIPVMNTAPALLGALAAAEVQKYLLGLSSVLTQELLLIDALRLSFLRVAR